MLRRFTQENEILVISVNLYKQVSFIIIHTDMGLNIPAYYLYHYSLINAYFIL